MRFCVCAKVTRFRGTMTELVRVKDDFTLIEENIADVNYLHESVSILISSTSALKIFL